MSKSKGLIHLFQASKFTAKGLKAAYQSEAAFRQELLVMVILAPFAFVVAQTYFQLALLISVLLAVLMIELLNTALESVVDRISLEQHPLAGKAKDLGSAAVFMAMLIAALVWGGVFIDWLQR